VEAEIHDTVSSNTSRERGPARTRSKTCQQAAILEGRREKEETQGRDKCSID